MIKLPGGRIAAGWHNESQGVLAVFDAATGRQLQELKNFGGCRRDLILSLALVEDHLLIMCRARYTTDTVVCVWSQDSAGKVRRQLVYPCGKEGRGDAGKQTCL